MNAAYHTAGHYTVVFRFRTSHVGLAHIVERKEEGTEKLHQLLTHRNHNAKQAYKKPNQIILGVFPRIIARNKVLSSIFQK